MSCQHLGIGIFIGNSYDVDIVFTVQLGHNSNSASLEAYRIKLNGV